MSSSLIEWKAGITSNILIPKSITNEWLKEQLKDTEQQGSGTNIFPLWGFCYQDLRKHDLSNIDLDLLLKVPFDSSTKWPKLLPKGFNPNTILKNRQLGYQFKEVHQLGITGKGILVAVIDHPTSINHIEIKDKIKKYIILDERFNVSHFHGLAVLSHLCGETLGIAPGVEVLFYGGQPYFGDTKPEKHQCIVSFAIKCLTDIKDKIKNGYPIRIVNMSNSWLFYGPLELQAEAAQLRVELGRLGCTVIDLPKFFDDFRYLVCKPTDDFENIDNYYLPPFFGVDSKKRLNFVTGGKVVASYLTEKDYLYDPVGSASYSIPQLSGLYALALQLNPQLSYELFIEICKENAVSNKKGYRIISCLATINAITMRR